MTVNQTRKLVLRTLRARSVRMYGVPYQPHNEDEMQEDFQLVGIDYVNTPLYVDRAVGDSVSVGVMAERAWLRSVLEQARPAHEQRPIWAGGLA